MNFHNTQVVLLGASILAGTVAIADEAVDTSLPEVTVTAQRREENLQNVPIAVTAFSERDLAEAGITDITRLDILTPGLTMGQSGSDTRPALRGVKTDNSRQSQADASVAFFIDGVYQSSNQEALAGFYDVSRVEVQRGPQGTLYGRNTFGGNISIVSNLPTKDFEGALTVERGNFNLGRYEAVFNLPASDTLGFRLVGVRETSDGWVANLSPTGNRLMDDDRTYFRGTAKWQPTANFTGILRANYWHDAGAGGGAYEYTVAGTLVDPNQPTVPGGHLNETISGVPIAINPRARATDGLPGLAAYPAGVPVLSDPWTVNQDTPASRDIHQRAASAELSYDFGAAILKSITSYNDFTAVRTSDADFTQFHLRSATQSSPNLTRTEELQLASKETTPLQWIGGLYYLNTRASEIFNQFFFVPNANLAYTFAEYDTKSYAGYAQASYNVTEPLRLTAGVRYTQDKKSSYGADYIAALTFPESSTTFNRTTWRAAADYAVTKTVLGYASVSTGFRSGGFNIGVVSPLPPTFAPEKVTAYEVGLKTRWLENRLQFNASAFYNDFTQLQLVGFDPITFLTYTVNAGDATAKGLDLELLTKVVPDLNVALTASYLDATYTHFVTVDPITFAGFFTGNGNQVSMSPKYRFGAAIDYTFKLGAAGALIPRIQTSAVSSYYLLDYNTPIEKQRSYTRTDARLTWRSAGGALSVDGYVLNIENKAVKTGGEFGGRGAFFIGYGPPRMYGVAASYRF